MVRCLILSLLNFRSENWTKKDSAKTLFELRISVWEDCNVEMTANKSPFVGY